MPVYRATLEPLDPMLFGDSRSARAGMDHLVTDQDPSPLTFFGAIGQYLIALAGTTAAPWPESLLGPEASGDVLEEPDEDKMLRLLGFSCRDGEGRLWFPNPRHVRWLTRGSSETLGPSLQDSTWSSSPFGGLLVGKAAEELAEALWISEDALSTVLCGRDPIGHEALPASELVRHEPRVGIATERETGLAIESLLFTRPYRRFREAPLDSNARRLGAGYTAWVAAPGALGADHLGAVGFGHLGGDRRRARVTLEEEPGGPLAALRDQVLAALPGTKGPFAYLLTPLPVPEDPRTLALACGSSPICPIAAALGKGRNASGWDARRHRPRRLLSMYPEGSVLFYRWPAGCEPESLVRSHWLEPIGDRGAAVGFGRALIGVWR